MRQPQAGASVMKMSEVSPLNFSTMIRAQSLRGSLFAAVSAIALSGCVSAVNEQFDTASAPPAGQEMAQNVSADNTDGAAVENAQDVQSAIAADAASQASASSGVEDDKQSDASQMAGLSTQPTAIAATQNSIFSSQMNAQSDGAVPDLGTATIPAYVPVPAANPAMRNLYQQDLTQQLPQDAVAAVEAKPQAAVEAVQPKPAVPTQSANSRAPSNDGHMTLAAFFAAAAKKRSNGSGSSADPVATIGGESAPNPMGIALVGRSSMAESFDEDHEEETPPPAGLMKLASLSSLSRVAPNGLRLQTETVSVGCMKPELVRRIKAIESHYKTPAIVTSGYRPRTNNVRRGSLHHSCDAADIQVAGVSKWELAKFLRSKPDRGGVGTYCHTESVHLDLGEARDWNWRCRAKPKKS
jgi:uncharacterized protein YcbK (DUF882 family)